MIFIGTPLRRTRSPLVLVKVPSMPVASGTSSKPMDLDIPPVTSPIPHTFPSFPESSKVRDSDLHSLVAMA